MLAGPDIDGELAMVVLACGAGLGTFGRHFGRRVPGLAAENE
jgi:hypothetical protein